MRISTILVAAILSVNLSFDMYAQADCGYRIRVYLRDDAGNTIKNARLKLNNWKEFYYRDAFNGYEASGLRGVGAPAWVPNLKVSAKGFTTSNHKLNISCAQYDFLLTLKLKGSKENADLQPVPSTDTTNK